MGTAAGFSQPAAVLSAPRRPVSSADRPRHYVARTHLVLRFHFGLGRGRRFGKRVKPCLQGLRRARRRRPHDPRKNPQRRVRQQQRP